MNFETFCGVSSVAPKSNFLAQLEQRLAGRGFQEFVDVGLPFGPGDVAEGSQRPAGFRRGLRYRALDHLMPRLGLGVGHQISIGSGIGLLHQRRNIGRRLDQKLAQRHHLFGVERLSDHSFLDQLFGAFHAEVGGKVHHLTVGHHAAAVADEVVVLACGVLDGLAHVDVIGQGVKPDVPGFVGEFRFLALDEGAGAGSKGFIPKASISWFCASGSFSACWFCNAFWLNTTAAR